MTEGRRLKDPRELTALAHPVRMGIIEQLTVNGQLTATELAQRLAESPANCSWHLRKLAEHGFVEEAEGGTGRRRPWRVPTYGFSVEESELGPEARTAAQQLESLWLERALDRYHDARVELADEPDWSLVSGVAEDVAWLTREEMTEVQDAIRAVLAKTRDRVHDPESRPADSRMCELVAWCVPVDFGVRRDAATEGGPR